VSVTNIAHIPKINELRPEPAGVPVANLIRLAVDSESGDAVG
jgi:hypothetical protein